MGKAFKRGKKLNSGFLSIRELKTVQGEVGELFQLKNNDGEPVLSKAYGNELWALNLANLDTGEIVGYWADAGLRGSFKMAKIQPGMKVEIVHTGEKQIDAGTVQTYDIFALE